MSSTSTASFFVVWNPSGGNPQCRHDTLGAAETEARRLAARQPGSDFYVLQALSVSRTNDPVVTVHLDDIPF